MKTTSAVFLNYTCRYWSIWSLRLYSHSIYKAQIMCKHYTSFVIVFLYILLHVYVLHLYIRLLRPMWQWVPFMNPIGDTTHPFVGHLLRFTETNEGQFQLLEILSSQILLIHQFSLFHTWGGYMHLYSLHVYFINYTL